MAGPRDDSDHNKHIIERDRETREEWASRCASKDDDRGNRLPALDRGADIHRDMGPLWKEDANIAHSRHDEGQGLNMRDKMAVSDNFDDGSVDSLDAERAAQSMAHKVRRMATVESGQSFDDSSVQCDECLLEPMTRPAARARTPSALWSFMRHRVQSLAIHDHSSLLEIMEPQEVTPLKTKVASYGTNAKPHTTADLLNAFTKKKRKMWNYIDAIRNEMEFKLWECALAVVAYLLVGMVAYSFVFEKWSIVDSLYFSVTTFTTVGFGDLSPKSNGGMMFTCLFATGGIAIVGMVLGVIGNHLIEAEMAAIEMARHRNRNELVEEFFDDDDFKRLSVREDSFPLSSIETTESSLEKGVSMDPSLSKQPKAMELHKEGRTCVAVAKPWAWRSLRCAPILFATLGVSSVFAWSEGWALSEAIYFCVITATTVGLGDYSPTRFSMRLFGIVFIPIAVGVTSLLLGSVANTIIDKRRSKALQSVMQDSITVEDLLQMDCDNDGRVSRSDYVEFMLTATKAIDPELLKMLHGQFNKLDPDNSGYLGKSNLLKLAREKNRRISKKLKLSTYKYNVSKQKLDGHIETLLCVPSHHLNGEG